MFRKKLWRGITSVLSFLLVLLIGGTAIAMEWAAVINEYLNVSTSKIIPAEGDTTDTQYFKSEFGEFTEANQKKLIEASWEQNVNEIAEGAVLMRNEHNALPLAKNSRVSLFGHATVDPMYRGVSAGSREIAGYMPTLFDAMRDDGFGVNEKLYNTLKASGTVRGAPDPWGVWTYGSALHSEDPISVYTDEVRKSWAEDYQDAAILSLVRMGGEHEDMNIYDMLEYTDQERDYIHRNETKEGRVSALSLIPEEKDLLEMLKEEKKAGRLKKIIVVLNTSSQMEVNWLDEYDVDACIFTGAYGAQGTRGLSKILSGEVNPSGHLVDTYAKSSVSAPSVVNFGENTSIYENYQQIEEINQEGLTGESSGLSTGSYFTFQAESIYIGYKYYETRYEDYILGNGKANSAKGASFGASEWKYENEISYPFGHGLSYTNFTQKLNGVTYDAKNDVYVAEVTVKNTGNVAGKSVAQIYAQTPYGEYEKKNKVEKSSVQLVGFGKTDLLNPGQEQTLTIEAERYLMASYDYVNAKGYILSDGDYYLALGDNAHDALNNIIAAKKPGVSGLVNFDGTSASGDTAKVYKFTQTFDKDAYKLSSNGVVVTNRFDDCDLNYWVDGAGTYLSRSDWDATYPVSTPKVTANMEMIKLLKGDYYEKPADAPTVAEATKDFGKDQGIKFIDMKDVTWEDDVMWTKFLKQMTLDELLTTVQCRGGRQPVESVALPQTKVGDGCDGIGARFPFAYEDTTGKWGSGKIEAGKMPTTRYASKTTLTCTFNRDLYARRGALMGEDGLWTGCTEVWGVGGDLHRNAFGGRAFEYMSEDANMAYMAAIPEVLAMEAKGMLAGIKHFAGNDQEWQRAGISTFFNEQAFREGSLRAFEGAIRVAKCKSLMQAFNRIGLRYAASCPALNVDVCDNEWGFRGHKETDSTGNSAVGYLSHYVTQLSSGTDTFCYNQNTAKPKILDYLNSSDDGSYVQYILGAAKHFYYAMSRSNAINGLSSNSVVIQVTPWWQTALYVSIAVASLLTLGGAAMIVVSSRKENAESAK